MWMSPSAITSAPALTVASTTRLPPRAYLLSGPDRLVDHQCLRLRFVFQTGFVQRLVSSERQQAGIVQRAFQTGRGRAYADQMDAVLGEPGDQTAVIQLDRIDLADVQHGGCPAERTVCRETVVQIPGDIWPVGLSAAGWRTG